MHRPPLLPGNTPGNHFCQRLSRPQGHSAIEGFYVNEKSTDTSWDRTSDLAICNTAGGWFYSVQSNKTVSVIYVQNCVSSLSTIETAGDKEGYCWNWTLTCKVTSL